MEPLLIHKQLLLTWLVVARKHGEGQDPRQGLLRLFSSIASLLVSVIGLGNGKHMLYNYVYEVVMVLMPNSLFFEDAAAGR